MARPKITEEGLARVASFRLTETDYDAYRVKFEASGLSQSEFFRSAVLTNATTVVARPKATADHREMLYQANKAGNNLNQLAQRIHTDHLAGAVTEATYRDVLSSLQRIARVFGAAVGQVE